MTDPFRPHRTQGSAVRPVLPGTRRLFLGSVALVLIAGVQLFVLTGSTDRFFAWTIGSEATAAFLGAGYLAAIMLEVGAARQRLWIHARIALPGVLVFILVTEIATLIHLDLFHFDSPHLPARIAAWAWLAVYTLVPVATAIVLVRQVMAPGTDPPRSSPLPRSALAGLGVQAAVLLGFGVALFVAADRTGYWPWPLTPLTARAVGAWLIGVGVGAAQAVWERDLERVRAATVAYLLFGALQLVAAARFAGEIRWSSPAAWLYVGFLATVAITGLAGWRMARSAAVSEPAAQA